MDNPNMPKYCPRCHTLYYGDQKYCGKCGYVFVANVNEDIGKTVYVNNTDAVNETIGKTAYVNTNTSMGNGSNPNNYNNVNYNGANMGNGYNNYYNGNNNPKGNGKNSAMTAVICVLVVIIVLMGAALAGVMSYRKFSAVPTPTPQVVNTKAPALPTPAPTPQMVDLSQKLDEYINNNTGGNVSVAVYDLNEKKYYSSYNSSRRYIAWGFYLPIYQAYAYQDYQYINQQTLNNILSTDVGVCNESANTAIRNMGGLDSVNAVIERMFRGNSTYYGRYFGQSSQNGENYTCAIDAIEFLKDFAINNDRNKLYHDLSHFGVGVPIGTAVCAQIGTENNSVRNQMNLFGIVRGANTDYCVVVLTENKTSNHITSILNLIENTLKEVR